MRGLWLLIWACACLLPSTARAAGPVLLLEGDSAAAWDAGHGRIRIELELAGFEVVAGARLNAALQDGVVRRLTTELERDRPLGVVATTRIRGVGYAYVATNIEGQVRVQRMKTHKPDDPGEVAIIALRVVELLNMSALTIDPGQRRAAEVAEPSEPPVDPPPEPVREPEPTPWLAFVAAGFVFSSDATPGALAQMGLSRRFGSLYLELSGYAAPIPSAVSVSAGRAEVRTGALTLHLGWFLIEEGPAALGVSLGGGGLIARSEASPAAGFEESSDTTTASVLSARIQVRYRLDPNLSLLAAVDPGVIIPVLSVRADGTELARLGRPWIPLTAGVGWSF